MFGHLPGPAMCCQKAAALYRAHFCGLGTRLHQHYGAWARWLVNRDSAFLALLGTALAEKPPHMSSRTCCNRFATPRDLVAESPALTYAAAVTLCGLSAKLEDDLEDEVGWRNLAARVVNRVLDRPISQAVEVLHGMRFPVADVRSWMAGQSRIEQLGVMLEDCAAPTRAAYGQIVAHLADVADSPAAKPALHQLGESLGFLIYAQDAWDDWAQDQRRGRFNPLHAFPHLGGRREALLPALESALAALRSSFESLPLKRNHDLLQAVLIDGAEQRVAQVREAGSSKPTRLEREGRKKGRCWDYCDCPADCCDCVRCCRMPKRGGSMCDCNPCDGDGIECCGCDCSP